MHGCQGKGQVRQEKNEGFTKRPRASLRTKKEWTFKK